MTNMTIPNDRFFIKAGDQVIDKLKRIETKTQLLQKKREKIRAQQAPSFVKEVQKF